MYSKEKITKKLLITEFVLYLFVVVGVISGNNFIVSPSFYAIFLCVVILNIYNFKIKVNLTTFLAYMIVCLSFISIFFSCLINDQGIIFSNLTNYFSFSAAILYMNLMRIIKVDNKTKSRMLVLGICVASIYPIGYAIFGFNTDSNLFSMNFSNPNLAGMFILQSVFYSIIGALLNRRVFWKIICCVIGILDCYLMFKTESRNCAISLAIVFILILSCKMRKKYKISNKILAFLSIFPLIFALLYLQFIDIISRCSLLSFMVSEGKAIDSREAIWSEVLRGMEGHYFFGNYIELSGNLHNSHLSILVEFGVFVFGLFVIFLYRIMKETNNNNNSLSQALSLIMFLGTIFMGLGEGALFCGSLGLFIPACSFLINGGLSFEGHSE